MVIGHYYASAEDQAGVPSEVRSLCRALGRQGVGSLLITAPGTEEVCHPMCRSVYISRDSRLVRAVGTLATLLRNHRELTTVTVYGAFSPDNIVPSLAALLLRIPLVVSPEGIVSPNGFKKRRVVKWLYWQAVEKPLLNRSAGIRVLSEYERETLQSYGIKTPMAIVREGVPEHEGHPPIQSARRLRPARTFLFLGRKDVNQKGLDILIDGFLQSLDEDDRGQQLLIVGPDTTEAKLESLIADRVSCPATLRNRITVMQPVYGKAKIALLQSADVFIHPSRREGIPRVMREALAAGLPVIATPETNLADLVDQYHCGWVVSGQPWSIKDGILAAIRSSETDLAELSANAISLAHTEFDWDSIARSLVSFITTISEPPDKHLPSTGNGEELQ